MYGRGPGNCVCLPLRWRRVRVTEERARLDWAVQIKELRDEDFPDAPKIVPVTDNANLRFENTQTIGSLYEGFEPEEARGIGDRLEIHLTPKDGRWLNMAEIEISVLNNPGLPARIPPIEQMGREAGTWNTMSNKTARTIDWRFTVADARIKLKRLYPHFNC
jgi:hypothetical protein